jgi:ankyrin repeat protein
VNAKETRRGQTALMWALDQNHLEAVRALVEGGADVHARSSGGFSPLLFAAKQGDKETARILLAAGANVNEGTPIRSLPAGRRRAPAENRPNYNSQASGDGNNSARETTTDAPVQERRDDDEESSDPAVPDGMTPLLLATASGHEDLATFLLENGADPNAADGTGATALHHAMLKGMALIGAVSTRLAVNNYVFRPNMVKLISALLVRGADPNARLVKDPRLPGNTPRFSLIGATPFMFATASGDIPLMRLLMQSGANPLLPTKENTTTLMVAAGLGNNEDPTEEQKKTALEAARILVDLGADVNAVGENGWTALHGAAYTGADDMTRFLVEKGARMDVKDIFGQTPFSIAAGQIGAHIVEFQKKPFGPHPSTANLLRTLGADPLFAEVLADSAGAPIPTDVR